MQFFLKVTLVVLVMLLSIAINVPGEYLRDAGVDPGALKATLFAWILVGLMIYRALAMILFTMMITLGANLPDELAAQWGVNRHLLLATLVVMVLVPLYVRIRRGF